MRVLITGKGGTAGSWAIRGEQLGEAIGATVFPMAEMAEIRASDLVVVVKRTPAPVIETIRAAGRPWVLDLVDGWPQPEGNSWSELIARSWLRERLATLRPSAVVFPTTQMREDSGWQGPALVLPHHAWPKYRPAPVSGAIQRVGYEGDSRYLGAWRDIVGAECSRRGWEFCVNGDLASCQIGVALREAAGYPARHWKANTKLANLQALGLPALVSPEASYREFGNGTEFVIRTVADVSRALDEVIPIDVRVAIASVAGGPRLADVAATYRGWLDSLC